MKGTQEQREEEEEGVICVLLARCFGHFLREKEGGREELLTAAHLRNCATATLSLIFLAGTFLGLTGNKETWNLLRTQNPAAGPAAG